MCRCRKISHSAIVWSPEYQYIRTLVSTSICPLEEGTCIFLFRENSPEFKQVAYNTFPLQPTQTLKICQHNTHLLRWLTQSNTLEKYNFEKFAQQTLGIPPTRTLMNFHKQKRLQFSLKYYRSFMKAIANVLSYSIMVKCTISKIL